MIAAWMIYGTIVGLLVASGARAADALASLIGYARRWVWVGALLLTAAVVAVAPLREAPSLRLATVRVDQRSHDLLPTISTSTSLTSRARDLVRAARQITVKDLAEVASIGQRIPSSARPWLSMIWLCGSAGVVVLLITVHSQMARARRRWPVSSIEGVRVRVAPEAGPAVVGLRRPEIVVPRWLFARSGHEQRLVIVHEAEHVRAHDPLLLLLGWLAVALMPWNLAAWWMLGRLRLAVELDCDARVLRGDVAPRSYGELLIDLAEHGSGLFVGTPALAGESSHLHQRLVAMQQPVARFVIARASGAAVLAAATLLVACEARMPTSADVDKMDVAAAERAATLALVTKSDAPRYVIDGVAVTPEQAHKLLASQVAAIEVLKSPAGGEIRIRTNGKVDTAYSVTRDGEKRAFLIRDKQRQDSTVLLKEGARRLLLDKVTGDSHVMINPLDEKRAKEFMGLVLIDGVRVDPSAIQSLNRESIVSIDVVKGAAAAREFNDPRAAEGVISIVTNKGKRP
jgi:beta-lactamase regulating signal transducer with metallopeptidase domain